MKKKIIYATIAFLSLLASSLPLSAQTPSVTTSGSITSTPDADGNYWFTFESYATGKNSETLIGPTQKTVDVILVMDCSYTSGSGGKLRYRYDKITSATYRNVTSAYDSYPYCYLHDDDKLYVIGEDGSGYLYYEVNGTKYYLTNNGPSTDRQNISTGSSPLPNACLSRLYKRNSNYEFCSDVRQTMVLFNFNRYSCCSVADASLFQREIA